MIGSAGRNTQCCSPAGTGGETFSVAALFRVIQVECVVSIYQQESVGWLWIF